MKIEVSREGIHNAVSFAEKVSGKNLTLPVLNCIFLSTQKNNLVIKATNLDLGVEITIPVKVVKEGSVAVPASIFSNTLSHTFAPNVTLEVVQGNLKIITPTSVSLLKSIPHGDFPLIPSLHGVPSFVIPAHEFSKGIKSVWYSASTTSIKQELASVSVSGESGKLTFAATDSFRLAEKIIPVKTVHSIETMLLPHRNIADIIRFLDAGEDDTVEIRHTENQIAFLRNGYYLTSRLVAGTFPDYRQIIPEKQVTESVVLKQDFSSSLKKTTIFSDKFSHVRVSARPSTRIFSLHAENPDTGETTESMQASLSGEDIDINFNHRYLAECLPSIASDSISLEFHGAHKPLILRGVSDSSFLYLVMPMNR